jgi:hypothetical protein
MKKFTIFAAILIFSLGLASASDAKTVVVDCDKGQNPEDVLETIAQGRGVDVVLKGDCGSASDPIFWHIEKDDMLVTGSTDDDEEGCPETLPIFYGSIMLHHVNRVELSCLKVIGVGGPGVAVEAEGSNFWIYHSEIDGNGRNGLALNRGSSATVIDSDIFSNRINGTGISLDLGSSITIQDVNVYDNHVGIRLDKNSSAVITDFPPHPLPDPLPDPPYPWRSQIRDNVSHGIFISGHSFVTISNSDVYGNADGGSEIHLSRDAGLVVGNGATVDGGGSWAVYCVDYESSLDIDGGYVTDPYQCSSFMW